MPPIATTTYGPVTLRSTFSDDAGFRQWAQGIHDAIVGAGLIQTADTGQIDFTTVTRPTNAYAGVALYRFNDSLQATRPIFLQVSYGTGSPNSVPKVALSVGTGTTGAGALTGATAIPFNSPTSTGGQNGPVFASHGEGSFALNHTPTPGTVTGGVTIVVDRIRDENGAIPDDGVIALSYSGTVGGLTLYLWNGGVVQNSSSTSGPTMGTLPGLTKVGTDILVLPIWYPRGRAYFGKCVSIGGNNSVPDVPHGTVFTATVLGVQQNFLSVAGGSNPLLGIPWA